MIDYTTEYEMSMRAENTPSESLNTLSSEEAKSSGARTIVSSVDRHLVPLSIHLFRIQLIVRVTTRSDLVSQAGLD